MLLLKQGIKFCQGSNILMIHLPQQDNVEIRMILLLPPSKNC